MRESWRVPLSDGEPLRREQSCLHRCELVSAECGNPPSDGLKDKLSLPGPRWSLQ